jgi:hypothetical protein
MSAVPTPAQADGLARNGHTEGGGGCAGSFAGAAVGRPVEPLGGQHRRLMRSGATSALPSWRCSCAWSAAAKR